MGKERTSGCSVPFPHHHDHIATLSAVVGRVRHFHQNKEPFRVYHGSTNSTRTSPYQRDNIVDISSLNRILKIDAEEMLVFVEPNVPMDVLVAETLKQDLLPPVVMEFPGITVGGGFSGTSGESSSFRHGFFDNTVEMVEVVIGNGDVLYASETQHADLFHGLATSCGTLGLVTMLCVRLIRARPLVSLTYLAVSSMEEAVGKVRDVQQHKTLDFIDGIFFSRESGVLCLGTMCDSGSSGNELQRFSRPSDDWFYIHADAVHDRYQQWTELVPIEDYLFRYNRGAFWMGKYTYRYFAVPLNRFTRWALDRYTHTRMMYHALHRSGLSNRYIIQDIAIPYPRSSEFLAYLDSNFKNYPIWICPLRVGHGHVPQARGFLSKELRENEEVVTNDQMMMNFGVWGPGPEDEKEFITFNRALEDTVQALGGWKWLYGHSYYPEQQFWRIYDRGKHDELRQKYHMIHVPNLYEKVRAKTKGTTDQQVAHTTVIAYLYSLIWVIWPLAGLYGWWQCIVSNEYLLPPPRRKAHVLGYSGGSTKC